MVTTETPVHPLILTLNDVIAQSVARKRSLKRTRGWSFYGIICTLFTSALLYGSIGLMPTFMTNSPQKLHAIYVASGVLFVLVTICIVYAARSDTRLSAEHAYFSEDLARAIAEYCKTAPKNREAIDRYQEIVEVIQSVISELHTLAPGIREELLRKTGDIAWQGCLRPHLVQLKSDLPIF